MTKKYQLGDIQFQHTTAYALAYMEADFVADICKEHQRQAIINAIGFAFDKEFEQIGFDLNKKADDLGNLVRTYGKLKSATETLDFIRSVCSLFELLPFVSEERLDTLSVDNIVNLIKEDGTKLHFVDFIVALANNDKTLTNNNH